MPAQSQILTPPATDESVGFFDKIFGGGWQNIIDGSANPSGPGGILFEMFAGFNAVTLAVVAILMFYVIGAGVIGTAHEGESLGRRYSTLWTPIRSAFSISLLMPLPWAKISLLQAIILKFVWFGIGGADYMAEKAIGYMASQNGAITMRAPTPDVRNTTLSMLGSVVVQNYFCEIEGQCGSGVSDFAAENGKKGFRFNPPSKDIPVEAMGSVMIDCLGEEGEDKQLCDEKLDEMKKMASDMDLFAKSLVSRWAEGADTDPDMNIILTMIRAYESKIQNLMQAAIVNSSGKIQQDLQEFKTTSETKGWVWLGSWYWKLAHFNERAQNMVTVKPIAEQVDYGVVAGYANKEYIAYMKRYETYVQAVVAADSDSGRSVINVFNNSDAWSLALSAVVSGITSTLGNEVSMGGAALLFSNAMKASDPIATLQSLGHAMINSGSEALTVAGTTGLIAKGLEGIGWLASKVPHKLISAAGTAVDAIAGGASQLTLSSLGVLFPIIMVIMLSGFALAYYIPAVPFILWTMAVIGWVILVLETMVAAPVWAAAHAIPEGEGLAGQHGRQGYMLFLGILIRPALMVIGFFMSYVIISVMSNFIGITLMEFIGGQNADKLPIGPPAHVIAYVAVLVLGVTIVVKMAHKVFGLITWMPEKVMRWVGGATESLGEHGDERDTHNVFVGAMGRVGQAMPSPRPPQPHGTPEQQSSPPPKTELGKGGKPTISDLTQGSPPP